MRVEGSWRAAEADQPAALAGTQSKWKREGEKKEKGRRFSLCRQQRWMRHWQSLPQCESMTKGERREKKNDEGT